MEVLEDLCHGVLLGKMGFWYSFWDIIVQLRCNHIVSNYALVINK